ncbi:transglutaminase domain-containing protein [Flavobacterium sp. DGU11]|uniref:Transglutaminase domain-containing protein n=1 Tax=Flavobacterium arundinis TaxID=3139143 RepID=A0ABU9HWR5_9FLAO
MKKITLSFFFFLFFCGLVNAQDFSQVDQKVETYPHSFATPDLLAVQINKDFSEPAQKARAAFVWISKNVKYDLDILAANKSGIAFKYSSEKERMAKEKKFKNEIATAAVNQNKAICHGYTALFELVCNKMGLDAITVTGTLKSEPQQIGVLPNINNHAWNLIKINNEWKFIDTTLAAGDIAGGKFVGDYVDGFFFTTPELFFLNHYPLEEKWLLTKKTKQEFANLPVYNRSYFKKGNNLLYPGSGILSASKGSCTIKLKNPDGIYLAYFLHSTYKGALMDYDENTQDYFCSINVSQDDYLTIMSDNEMIITYKVKVKP